MSSYVGVKAFGMGFDAHLTVYYFGDERDPDEVEAFIVNDIHKQREYYAVRKEIAMFGYNHDIPVALVIPGPYLSKLQRKIVHHFGQVSEFDWNPHITLKLDHNDVIIPKIITLGQLGVY